MAGEKPYIANGITSDPREQICWDIYVDNLAKGLDNAYEAGVSAGYSHDHSRNLTMQGWFKERKAKLHRKEMLSKAERNLGKVLDFNMHDDEGKVNTPVATLVSNVSTTIVKTLGKDIGYSDRTEHTGANGKDLIPLPPERKQEIDKVLGEIEY